MIIRSRRKNESFLRRLIRAKPTTCDGLVSVDTFKFEIIRETSRSNRRPVNREFAIVTLHIQRPDPPDNRMEELVVEFKRRLRVSDTLGMYEGLMAVLLPETNRENAMLVANDLAKLGLVRGFQIDTEIYVFPWDDQLVASADELSEGENVTDTDVGSANGQPSEVVPELDQNQNQGVVGDAQSNRNCFQFRGNVDHGFDSGRLNSSMAAFQPSVPTPMWKRWVDIVGSSIGLVFLSPVFVSSAIAIRVNSPGPVFFKQLREGKDGKQFNIWKFRTMYRDAETHIDSLRNVSEQDGPAFKLKNDPRVTSVGHYLRRSCVDELPQLVNVLRGEMSLVGPRPLPVAESEGCAPWQRHRLRVLPGLTCVWQVEGGRDTKFDDWMRMDMQYIRKRSFLYDLNLIFRTAMIAIMHRGSV